MWANIQQNQPSNVLENIHAVTQLLGPGASFIKCCAENHPKFDLTIISQICVRVIHRMNVRTEIARTPLFQI